MCPSGGSETNDPHIFRSEETVQSTKLLKVEFRHWDNMEVSLSGVCREN